MTTLNNKTSVKKEIGQKLALALTGTTLALTGFATTFSLSYQPASAGANDGGHKYKDKLQVVHCPNDRIKYGDFYDYGYWGNTNYCGQETKPGYWYWANPNWYIWENKK